jgi:HlyD family secretion protein
VDTQTLKNMSLDDLQDLVDYLREELENLVNFVHAQEQELTIQAQTVSQLQDKLFDTTGEELSEIKTKLAQEQEKAKMLEETLIGQYRNLHKREVDFKEHLYILLEKKGLLHISEDEVRSDLKLILALLEQQEKPEELVTPVSKSSQSKKWLIILGAIALLLLGGGIIYYLSQRTTEITEEVVPVETEIVRTAVTALGRIEPSGEVIKIAAPPTLGAGAKVAQLLIKTGDQVKAGQVVAVLEDYPAKEAMLKVAQQEVEVTRRNLAIIQAGAKTGEINAQKATINRLEAQLNSEMVAREANLNRLKARLARETEVQEATIARLQSELNNAQLEFARYQQLVNDGVMSSSELDTRRTTLETAQESVKEAQANLQRIRDTLTQEIAESLALKNQANETLLLQIAEAKANLERIQEIRPVDVAKAESQVQKAIASLRQQEAELELSTIKAPIAGQIIKIHSNPGEAINIQTGLAELGQTQQMVVVAEVYESDITKVKVGQPATMTSESGAFDAELQGTVSEIGWQVGKKDVLSSDPAASVDVRVIEVKIALDPESTQIVSGLTYAKVIVRIFTE